ncbi:MAG: hypothetical protein NVS3B20_16070 [Polyangiales bacterium]
MLVAEGTVTAAQLAQALELQERYFQEKGRRRRLGRVLVDAGFVEEAQLTQVLSRLLTVPSVSLYHVEFSRQLLNLVPREIAEEYGLIPVYVRHVRGQGDTLYVATDDPTNEEGLRRAGVFAGLPVRPMLSSASDIRAALRVYYGATASIPPIEPPAAAARPRERSNLVDSSLPQSAQPPPPSPQATQPPQSAPAKANWPADSLTTARVAQTKPTTLPRERGEARAVAMPEVTAKIAPPLDQGAVGGVREGPPAKPVRAGTGRTVSLTFLDGTTFNLPRPAKKGASSAESAGGQSEETQLTARDLVSALRAVSHGADATEVLGDNPRWEPLFAALLSLLLRKHLIADWEFVEELKPHLPRS